MSAAGIDWPLEDGETLLWQGRPAPRCYTFRHWKLALAGSVLFLACSFWMMLGLELVNKEGHSPLLFFMTLPLVATSFLLGPWQIVQARWRWEKIFYALTERRLLIRDGFFQARMRSYPVEEITGWQRRRFGDHLASIRLLRGAASPVIVACIEYPENFTRYLPEKPAPAQQSGDSV